MSDRLADVRGGAARHVDEGVLPLKEIAGLAGDWSVAAFGKAFKRWSGEAPSTVRRSAPRDG